MLKTLKTPLNLCLPSCPGEGYANIECETVRIWNFENVWSYYQIKIPVSGMSITNLVLDRKSAIHGFKFFNSSINSLKNNQINRSSRSYKPYRRARIRKVFFSK